MTTFTIFRFPFDVVARPSQGRDLFFTVSHKQPSFDPCDATIAIQHRENVKMGAYRTIETHPHTFFCGDPKP